MIRDAGMSGMEGGWFMAAGIMPVCCAPICWLGALSVARRTVRVRSPMRMPFSPAHATSVTLASAYTTKPYLRRPAAR